MPNNVDETQQLWKENMDFGMKSFGAMSKGFQAIAVEFANYFKRSLEDHTAATERLMGAKSLEKASVRRSYTSRSRVSSAGSHSRADV